MKTPYLKFAKPGSNTALATCLIAITAGAFAGVLFAQGAADDAKLLKEAQGTFQPLPKDAGTAEYPVTPDRVTLGRKLFFDPRISSMAPGAACAAINQRSTERTGGPSRSVSTTNF